jgi:hypothetical protein
MKAQVISAQGIALGQYKTVRTTLPRNSALKTGLNTGRKTINYFMSFVLLIRAIYLSTARPSLVLGYFSLILV